ncbi:hypothetical protein N0V93_001753 [Gnomoniopsis smithogilvyi]|uniref:Amidase domain-containing protein n=1 Tax=Gnomoniopsis smithogilvyi TaxID=1191159 RepID=A0A9W8Z288_9PEZI|nr:hypothetical protein N0V93_001753 [Gnomoniopsis smithogilvyi]
MDRLSPLSRVLVIVVGILSLYWSATVKMLGSAFIQKLAALAAIAVSACQGQSSTAINGEDFPPLIEATLEDLVSGLDSGLFTSVDLVNAYTARILEVNSTLRMVTELNPDALSIAATLDSERASGTSRGPLHGIPILIKNNIATDDKMNNTAGSYALLGAKVPSDSTMAAKLRKAGAILLGKTNLSQWANYRSDNTSNGWSAYGGQTEGAYFPGQDPSGSSSGSGVSSSLGLALACLGTETDGSILSPSNVNNLVGIKPSVGLTSRYLVVPISEHQDTVGPMARTVKDAAHILTAIAGPDPKDNYTSAIPFNSTPNYIEACQLNALKGKRIGVPRNYIDLTGESYLAPVIPVFNAALDILRDAGATVVDNITLPGYDVLAQANFPNIVLEADFNTDLAKYFAELTVNPNNLKTVSDLRNFTQGFPLEDYPERDTDVWDDAIELGYGNTAPEFWSNYTADLFYAGPLGVTGALTNFSLDALVVPTDFAPFLPALIGAPVVTVPLGALPPNTTVQQNGFGNLNASAPNLPFGFSFLGARFDEFNLIGLAYAFEQRTLVRNTIKPYIEPTTELVDVVNQRKAARV